MGEPAYQLPDDDKPDIRPHLRSLEGGGETTPPARGHLHSVGDDNAETRLGAQEGIAGGASNQMGSTGQGSDSGEVSRTRRALRKAKTTLWGTKLRRNTTIGGGIVGLLVGGLGVGSMWFAGPLELVHIAQFLTKSHFQTQQDQGDERMGRLYRFVRSNGEFGETRLGWIGAHYKTTMIADMEKIGLKPVYGAGTVMKGFEIDTTNENSPYHGMSEDEIRTSLKSDGFGDNVTFKDGKVSVSSESFFKQRGANKLLVDKLGYGKISGALRVRILNKYGMVTWHPLKRLDAKLNDKLSTAYDNWKKARDERLKTGVDPSSVEGATSEKDTQNGKTTTTQSSAQDNAIAGETVTNPEQSSSLVKTLVQSPTAKVAGGVAAIQALVCGLRGIADGIDTVHYVQVVLPLMRMGWDAVTVGNQIMAGQDVDAQTVKFVSKSFSYTDPKTKQTSNWNQAASIQAEMGNSGGVAAPEAYNGIAAGIPSWLTWTQNSAVSASCSTAASIIGGGVSVVLGVISGGVVSTLTGLVVGAIAAPRIMDAATHMLAGQAVNVDAAGAEWGSAIDYGSRLNANAVAMQFGGAPLTTAEVAQLDNERNSANSKDFASKSFAYRMFDIHDNRTLASKLIDNSTAIQPQNVATTVGNMFTNIGSFLRMPASLLAAKAHAAAPYDYGFPQFGFSQSDMDNSLVSDPYANADAVAKILDGPDGQPGTSDDDPGGYIQRAEQCFGIQISYADQGWQAVTDPSAGGGQGVNAYSQNYPKDCRDAGNNDWLRVRFFIFDIGEAEGYACYQGDQTSCQHDGVTDSPNPTGAGANFSIASFNVQGAIHTPNGWQSRMDRSIKTITSNNLDIVGLQEFEKPQRDYLMQQIGGTYDIYPQTADYGAGNPSVNSIIWDKSKFTLVKGGTQPGLKYFGGAPLNAPWVELQSTSGQQFYVLNTHDPAHPQYADLRYQNALAHVTYLQQLKQDNLPIFFTGDFNSGYQVRNGNSGNPTYQGKAENLTYCIMTKDNFMYDAYDLSQNRQAKCPNPGKNYIDHLFVTSDVQIAKFTTAPAPQNGSDVHDTMMFDVVIPGSGSGSGGTGAASLGKNFVGDDGFVSGSCVQYVEYILSRHVKKSLSYIPGDGKDIASNLGHMGYTVNNTPAIHATVSFPTSLADPTYGHVALVAAINKDGSIVVEEANWSNSYHYGTHTVPASEVGKLTYAHTEVGWH